MINTNISVVFTPDENFIVQTSVAILSMLMSKKKETNYTFHIVVSQNFRKESFEYLERIKSLQNDFSYEIHYIDSSVLDSRKITTRHVTSSTYYRLVLADVIEDDKCMYHDGDILVFDDLTEMFDIEIENYYVAGIKAIMKHQDTKENREAISKWKFSSFDNYIFAGDLIFNLKKIREDNLIQQFVEHIHKGYPSEDQDVINMCCYGRIKFLPLRYCMLNRWINGTPFEDLDNIIYSDEEMDEARNNPAIIHFAGADTKPWTNVRAVYADKWWELAKKILTQEEYAKWRIKAETITRERDWDFFVEKLSNKKNVIIFGFSDIARELCNKLIEKNYNVVCFADNDKGKQGKCYADKEVIDIKSAIQQYGNANIVIASQNYRKAIREQLINCGVDSLNIIDYFYKSYIYYQALDEKYYYLEDVIAACK